MKKRKKIDLKKIHWLNVTKVITLLVCIGVLLHDFYRLSIEPFVTGQLTTFTWFGLITSALAFILGYAMYEDISEQMEKMPTNANRGHV